jgi:hypothetical protein
MIEGQLGQWPDRPPLVGELGAVIRHLADGGYPIGWAPEIDDVLLKHDLDMSDLMRGFRTGHLVGPVAAGDDEHEWVCTISAPVLRGSHKRRRELGIKTVVIEASSLFIAKLGVTEI